MENIKVALSLMVEENEPIDIVKRAIESIEKYIDGVFVTVTFKDKQPESSPLIIYLKEKKVNLSFFKWIKRFDSARNFAVSQIPKEYNYYLWMDADDVWYNPQNLSQVVKEAYLYNQSAVFFDYWYMVELDEHSNVKEILVKHKRERLIKNDDNFKWVGRLHETLIEQRQFNIIKVYRKEVMVVHLTDDTRSRKNLTRNIEILEESLKEEQRKDPRTIMYLGKAYYDRARLADEKQREIDFQLAEVLFHEYLNGSGVPGLNYQGSSGWSEERSTGWQYLSEIYRFKKLYNKAIRATANAMIEGPQFPAYYLDMAMNYVLLKQWDKAKTWVEIAKHIPFPNTTIIEMPKELKTRALEVDYHIAVAKNELDNVEIYAQKLSDLYPTSVEMKDRLTKIQTSKIINKAAQSIVYLAKYLEGINEKDKIVPLINSVPAVLHGEQFYSQMKQKFLPPKLWKDDEITIVCGPGFEKWSPKSLDKGLGGSENAVIYLSKYLAKLGYKVTVFADPQDEQGEYDGVTYKQWYEVNLKDIFNILILWRAIGFVDNNFYAKQTYLWAHDVPNCADFTENRLKRVDKIMPLSAFHKGLFKMFKDNQYFDIPEEKFFLTANGVPDVELGDISKIVREPHRCLYTSSIDRGLVHLLLVWPEIKDKVPDATLHVFYGWHVFDAIFRDNPERKAWKAKMMQMMNQPGITYHGRVGHKELVEETLKSSIFAYPADFQEISCISAMTSQKYGAIPIVTNFAALKETVQFGKKLDIDVASKEGREAYAQEIIRAFQDDKWQNEERVRMMDWAKDKFTWKEIAQKWDNLFKEYKGKE